MAPGPVKHKLSKFLQIRSATYDRARRHLGRGFGTINPEGGANLAKPAYRTPAAKPGALGNLCYGARGFDPRGLCCGLFQFWL